MIYGSVYDRRGSETNGVPAYNFDESLTLQEMGAQMLDEAAEDWNSYMKAIALTELTYVMEHGEAYIYESVDIKAMAEKVKEWFKKLWAKIQGIAKSAMAKLNQFVMSDEKFISKYQTAIEEGERKAPDGFSIKGYNFKNFVDAKEVMKNKLGKMEDFSKSADDYVNTYKTDQLNGIGDTPMKDNKKKMDKQVGLHRAELVGMSREISDSEFSKELKKFFYGSLDKTYIKKPSATDTIKIIKDAKENADLVKEAQDEMKEALDEAIDLVNEAEQKCKDAMELDAHKDDPDARHELSNKASQFSHYSSYLKTVQTINAKWISAYLGAIKDRNRQAKAVATKYVQFYNGVGGKKEVQHNSTYMSGSLLEDRFAAIEF